LAYSGGGKPFPHHRQLFETWPVSPSFQRGNFDPQRPKQAEKTTVPVLIF